MNHRIPSPSARSLGRRSASWLALYVFGLAVTTLLVAVWGQAVTGDEASLAAGVRAAVETELIAEGVETWLTDSADTSATETPIEVTLRRVAESPEVSSAIEALVDSIVAGAIAGPGSGVTIDPAAALAPVGNVLTAELARSGVPVAPERVSEALAGLEPIVLTASDTVANAVRGARGALTVAAVAATLIATAGGGLAILLAEDRIAIARTLVLRVAIGAMTFVLFARIGAWALDPAAGRSPVAAGGAALLRSQTGLMMAIMAVGALAGSGLGVYAVRRKRTASEPATGAVDLDEEPTAERELVGV